MLMEANEYLLDHKDDDKDDPAPPSVEKISDDDTEKEDTDKGTLTIDATCSPANIRYLQDVSHLNEARENWKISFTIFVNAIALSCQEDTANVPEKSILRLPRAKNIHQRRTATHFVNSFHM
jgi:hypothetical protein